MDCLAISYADVVQGEVNMKLRCLCLVRLVQPEPLKKPKIWGKKKKRVDICIQTTDSLYYNLKLTQHCKSTILQ